MKKNILFFTFLLMMGSMTGCSVTINNHEYDIGTYVTAEDKLTENVKGMEKFEISNGAGNISIVKSGGEDIRLSVTKKVRGSNEKKKKEILDNIKINITKENKKVIIEAKTKKDGNSDFWKWKEQNYKVYNVTIDYTLEVPEYFNSYAVENGAGNTELQGTTGDVSIKNGVGDIRLKDMEATLILNLGTGNITGTGITLKDMNSVNLGAGNVTLDANVDGAKQVNIDNGMGNVTLNLPKESKVSLNAGVGIGNISGSFINESKTFSGSIRGDYNGGGTDVRVKAGTGNVTIDSK